MYRKSLLRLSPSVETKNIVNFGFNKNMRFWMQRCWYHMLKTKNIRHHSFRKHNVLTNIKVNNLIWLSPGKRSEINFPNGPHAVRVVDARPQSLNIVLHLFFWSTCIGSQSHQQDVLDFHFSFSRLSLLRYYVF